MCVCYAEWAKQTNIPKQGIHETVRMSERQNLSSLSRTGNAEQSANCMFFLAEVDVPRQVK